MQRSTGRRLRYDAQLATQQSRSFLHSLHAHSITTRLTRPEAATIVNDAQLQLAVAHLGVDAHDGRVGVLANVGQRFLQDAQYLDLGACRERRGLRTAPPSPR